ncbi:Glutamate receptor 3-3 [Nymphaea thermarum]|nr:Glutamate receptor 3-3 [Nymphaea thermarum]
MIPACILVIIVICSGVFVDGSGRNASLVVNLGAICTFSSTIGSVAKIAITTAVEDINSNSSILGGTKLNVTMLDSNTSAFLGIVEALQFMEKDIVAIVGPQSSVLSHVVSHVADELQVPLLSFAATDPTLSSLQYPFFVRTTQSDFYQMAAIAEFVDYYRWKEVIALFVDDDYGRSGVSALADELEDKRCRISYKAALRPGMTKSDAVDMLVKLALMESRVIVVHVNPGSGLMIFSVAEYLGMMSNGYVWIATDWLSSYLDTHGNSIGSETMRTLQGVIVMRQHVPESEKKKAFVSRWNDLVKKEGLSSLGLNSYGLYAYDTVWLLAHALNAFLNEGGTISFSNDPMLHNAEGSKMNLEALSIFDEGKELLRRIWQTDFIGVTGHFRFDSSRDLLHPAYDVINVVGTGFRIVGYWSNYSGLSIETPEILYSKPPNISNEQLRSVIWPGDTTTQPRGWVFPNNGKQLIIGVPNRASYKEFVSLVKGTDNTMNGFCIDVFTAALNLLPYPVAYKFVPFGDGKSNPNYNELVQRVETRFFGAAVGDIAIVTNRTRLVDFTQPFAESGLVVVASTKRMKSGAWAFLKPFTLKMWCATAAFFIIMGAVVWTLEHRVNDEFRGPPRQQIVTVLWFSFSTMFFAHRENMMSTLGRFVLVMWLFVVLIINSSYTASLTSILTVQQLSSPITGIESLIASGEPIGFQIGSYAENYLIELGVSKSRLQSLRSPEDYADALEKGPTNGGVAAVVDELPYIELFLSKHCKFAIRGKMFTKSGWGFAFRRDSPLATDFSTAILSLAENGDLQRIHDKWLTNSGCASQSDDISSNQLDLRSFWGLFLICGITSVVALSIFFWRMAVMFTRHGRHHGVAEPSEGSSRTRRLRTFFSFVDEREDTSVHKSGRKNGEEPKNSHSSGRV